MLIRVKGVKKAFGEKPAVVITGGDRAGSSRALAQVAERFPAFDNDLRVAMFEEPVRFIEDVIRNDRSVLDLLYGAHTFVNPPLAKHYGMPEVSGKTDHLVRVDDAR